MEARRVWAGLGADEARHFATAQGIENVFPARVGAVDFGEQSDQGCSGHCDAQCISRRTRISRRSGHAIAPRTAMIQVPQKKEKPELCGMPHGDNSREISGNADGIATVTLQKRLKQ